MIKSDYDIVILGGGMAGLSLALSLAAIKSDRPLRLAVFEKTAFENNQQNSFDDRCIALSAGSQQIYQSMGIWNQLTDVEAILNIHISEQAKIGFSRLNHEQEKVDALGYVVPSHALGKVLIKQLQQRLQVDIFCPAKVKTINFSTESARLEYDFNAKEQSLTAALVVAADGGQSCCHQYLSSAPTSKAYNQSAIIANIETQYPHHGEAFERFTESGPLAVLPLTNKHDSNSNTASLSKRCSLVWTVKENDLANILSLSDKDFIAQLQHKFGYRLGSIQRVGKRFSYPLILKTLDLTAVTQLKRLVFVGNAAHAIHPVTGQGFNLGLRDISALSQLIEKNMQQNKGKFIYQTHLIGDYWQQREKDIKQVSHFTDTLIRLFSNKLFPLTPARNMGLILFELCQPLKSILAHFAMGRQN